MALLLGFYLGGFFYVSMLVWEELGNDIEAILVSGAMWPYGLYQLLSGKV